MHHRHSPQVRIEPRKTRSPLETPGGRSASGTDLLKDADGLMAELPRHGCLRVPIEERPRVGAADPARLYAKDGSSRVERRVLGVLANLDGVHSGHERGAHQLPSSS